MAGHGARKRRIAAIKAELLHAQDFTEVARRFLELLETDLRLLEASRPCDLPLLRSTLGRIGAELSGSRAPATCWLLRLEREQLVHGSCLVGGRIGSVFYFEDVGVGLLALALDLSGVMHYARFRLLRRPRGDMRRN